MFLPLFLSVVFYQLLISLHETVQKNGSLSIRVVDSQIQIG